MFEPRELDRTEGNRELKLKNDETEIRIAKMRLENEKLRAEVTTGNRALQKSILQDQIEMFNVRIADLMSTEPIDERARILRNDKIAYFRDQMDRLAIQINAVNSIMIASIANSPVLASGDNQMAIVAAGGAPLAIEAPQDPPPPIREEITFDEVARGMDPPVSAHDVVAKRSVIGRRVAAKFRMVHGCEPVKHKQVINGRSISTNTYFKEHRALIAEAIREVFPLPIEESESDTDDDSSEASDINSDADSDVESDVDNA